jgi:hypothetical protein
MGLLKLHHREELALIETTQLTRILQEHLSWHKARVRFAAAFILALLRVRSVSFPSLALALNPHAQTESNERRLQRFFSSFKLDLDAFARLLLALVPVQGKLVLTLDRTHWQVGSVHLNILLFGVAHNGVAFPIVWRLLGKSGNSNQAERKALLSRLLRVIPKERIAVVLADREFISEAWFETLTEAGIAFVIRIRKNALVSSRGFTKNAEQWIAKLGVGEIQRRQRRVVVYGQRVFLTLLRRGPSEDDVMLASNRRHGDALSLYSLRWSIETLFLNLKSRGFDLEATRLRDGVRVERLVALLALTFAFAYRVGLWLSERVPVRLKGHGRRARSVFRMGLDHLRGLLLNLPYRGAEFSRCLHVLEVT